MWNISLVVQMFAANHSSPAIDYVFVISFDVWFNISFSCCLVVIGQLGVCT